MQTLQIGKAAQFQTFALGGRAVVKRSRRTTPIVCCNGQLLGYLGPAELVRRAVSATVENTSHHIIQAAPNGASLWLTTFCALSVALGALTYNLMSILSEFSSVQRLLYPLPGQARHILYGVDVTNSRFFRDETVLAAVKFAAAAHHEQQRKTGEPYVSHCIETALIVEHNLPPAADYDKYTCTIVAALLHDVIDDTSVELTAIQKVFGEGVAGMVSKVSKLSQMNQLLRRGKRKGWADYSPEHFKQLRKMIVDMVFEEPLVILIKLADRLHNMRSVFVLKPEKQRSVAEETLEVWCSMAECLGWDAVKSEMEDLCFAVMQPDKYCCLRAELDTLWHLPSLQVVEDLSAAAPPLLPASSRTKDKVTGHTGLSAALVAATRDMLDDGSDVNIGIRIVNTSEASASKQSVEAASARWEIVSWTVTHNDSRGDGASQQVNIQAAPGSGAVVKHHEAEPSSSSSSSSHKHNRDSKDRHNSMQLNALYDTMDSSTHATYSEQFQQQLEQLQRLHSHSAAGPGPQSLGDADASSTGTGAMTATASSSSTTASSSTNSSSIASSLKSKSGSSTSAASCSSALAAAAAAGSSGLASYGASTAVAVKTAVLEPAPATAPATASTLASSLDRLALNLAAASSSTAAAAGAGAADAAALPAESSAGPVSISAKVFEAQLPAEQVPQKAGSTSTRSSSASSSATCRTSSTSIAVNFTVQSSGVAEELTPQQQRLKAMISTVVPFDSVNFKNTRNTKQMAFSTRRGLEVLDECASVLYNEIQLRSAGGGLTVTIQGRLKSLYSVYRKMLRKKCSVREVYDARALRVIVDDEGGKRMQDAVDTCYKLVSAVHSIWKAIPAEFDDYIANPKPSGYQALHTAVKGPGRIPMEIQIKTSSMHELAEYGAAAHWVYKEYVPLLPPTGMPRPKRERPPRPDSRGGGSPPARKAKGYVGQPLLRIAKDKLRYGVVVGRDSDGKRLLCAVKLGSTFSSYPTRVPDYAFYHSMWQYTRVKGWRVPGHGDFTLRVEEYVLAKDGRYHRRDHMGYVLPAEYITLLEGFEEEHTEACLHMLQAEGPAVDLINGSCSSGGNTTASASGTSTSTSSTSSSDNGLRAAAAAAVSAGGVDEDGSLSSTSSIEDSIDEIMDPATERFRRQMQEAYLRTQQLRSMIEWGRSAIGRYSPEAAQSDEISVLIWPGGNIEYFARGTTAGQIIRDKGLITISNKGSSAHTNDVLINVNNRLVPEDTVLNDGDLVILSREKVKI